MLFFVLMLTVTSCSKNKSVRKYGGSENIAIRANEKFLNMSWKDNNMWIITVDTVTHVGYAREYSQYGILNGEVEFTPTLPTK